MKRIYKIIGKIKHSIDILECRTGEKVYINETMTNRNYNEGQVQHPEYPA